MNMEMRENVIEAIEEVRSALKVSSRLLDLIGDGDWTPQDSAHAHLAGEVANLLELIESRFHGGS